MTDQHAQLPQTEMNIAEFPIQKLLHIVSNLLDSMLHTNNQIPTTQITYFHSRAIPNISVLSYLTRIHKFAPFTNEALLSMLIYFDRITKTSDHGFTINSYNIHRLLITSIVVASKFTSDIYYANSRYAKVGGIPLRELNQLELELLFLLDFQLYIKVEDVQEYADQLLSHAISCSTTNIHTTTTTITTPTTTTTTTTTAAAAANITTSQTVSAPSKSSPSTHTHHKLILPLTPPYNPSTIEKPHKYHPYQVPTQRRRKLGLVSPKD